MIKVLLEGEDEGGGIVYSDISGQLGNPGDLRSAQYAVERLKEANRDDPNGPIPTECVIVEVLDGGQSFRRRE